MHGHAGLTVSDFLVDDAHVEFQLLCLYARTMLLQSVPYRIGMDSNLRALCGSYITVMIPAATHFLVIPKNVCKNASAYHGISA